MVRTFGSQDLKPRKSRSDIGKKRKLYSGKPVVGRKNKPLRSKSIGRKTHIKIKVYEIRAKTKDQLKMFSKQSRRFFDYPNWIPLPRTHYVKITDIDTQKKLEQWVADNYYPGEFAPKTVVPNKKSKSGFCWKRLCRIIVRENDKGQYGTMMQNYRLRHYSWFYKD